jgi:hypothetical protein
MLQGSATDHLLPSSGKVNNGGTIPSLPLTPLSCGDAGLSEYKILVSSISHEHFISTKLCSCFVQDIRTLLTSGTYEIIPFTHTDDIHVNMGL